MSVFQIVLMIFFFIYFIFCIELYLSWCVAQERRYEKKLKRNEQFKLDIQSQLNKVKNQSSPSLAEVRRVRLLLKRRVYFDLFNEVIMEAYQETENRLVIRQYMLCFEGVIESLLRKKFGMTELSKLRLSKLVGYYQLDSQVVQDFLLDCLKQNSIYLKLNALTALAQIGNLSSFLEAIDIVSSESTLYNDRFLIDIFGKYTGHQDYLHTEIVEKFHLFTVELQVILVQYFTTRCCSAIEPVLIEVLAKNEKSEKELHLGAIRYFMHHPKSCFEPVLIKYLTHSDWEYRALSATALKHYMNESVIDELFKAIEDKNWYVRFNSAMTLCAFQLEERIKKYIEKTNDHYSKDILSYALLLKEHRLHNELI